MNKFEVIKLLNQGIYSYKELSEITGYHEKSLIRLNLQILKGLISPIHGNKNRKPHNYISNDIKIKLVNEFKKGDFKSYQSFYLYLKEN